MQDLLTAFLIFITLTFTTFAVFDFVVGLKHFLNNKSTNECVLGEELQLQEVVFTPTPQLKPAPVKKSALEHCSISQAQLVESTLMPDPWLITTDVATQTCCCCATNTTETTPMPLLLIASVLEVTKQPELANQPDPTQMNAEQLRKLCNNKGVKWRNANGRGRHFKKEEMLRALATP